MAACDNDHRMQPKPRGRGGSPGNRSLRLPGCCRYAGEIPHPGSSGAFTRIGASGLGLDVVSLRLSFPAHNTLLRAPAGALQTGPIHDARPTGSRNRCDSTAQMDSFHSHHLDRVGSEPLFALYGPCEAEDSTIVPATGSERSRASTGAPVGNRDAWKHGRHSLGPRALESAAAQHGTCVASLLHGIAVRQPECPESHGKPRNKRQHAISRLENGQQLKNGGFLGKIMVAEEGSMDASYPIDNLGYI